MQSKGSEDSKRDLSFKWVVRIGLIEKVTSELVFGEVIDLAIY